MINKLTFLNPKRIQQTTQYIVWVTITLTYWYFGFYPFHLELPIEIESNAIFHPTSDVIRFNKPGIGYTLYPPEWLESAIAKSKLDIDLELQTMDIDQYGPARILSLSDDLHSRNLTIAQEGPDLILRLRTEVTNENGFPPYRIENVFEDREWHQLRISIASNKLSIFVNKSETVTTALPDNPMRPWSMNYQLALGNEFTHNRPWLGTIRHAIIESGKWKVDYAKKGTLHFPKLLLSIKAKYQLIPFPQQPFKSTAVLDRVVNLFGFIPFGLLIILTTKGRLSVLKAITLCGILSLSIEIGQLFIAERVTAVEDLILNILGGALGALIGILYLNISGVIPFYQDN